MICIITRLDTVKNRLPDFGLAYILKTLESVGGVFRTVPFNKPIHASQFGFRPVDPNKSYVYFVTYFVCHWPMRHKPKQQISTSSHPCCLTMS